MIAGALLMLLGAGIFYLRPACAALLLGLLLGLASGRGNAALHGDQGIIRHVKGQRRGAINFPGICFHALLTPVYGQAARPLSKAVVQ